MADPLTLAMVGVKVLGGFMQSRAQEAQYAAQQQQLQAQAAAADYNKRIAEQNAEIVSQQTQAELEKQDRERRLRAGMSRASAGASGIGAESFGDILQSSAAQEELDLLTIQSEGLLRQREFEQQAGLLGMEAQSSRGQAKMVKSAAKTSKAASLISGISSGLGAYGNMTGGGTTFLDGSARVSNGVKWNTSRSGSFL